MSTPRKGAWRHYLPVELELFAKKAARTSQHSAARTYGVSRTTIRRAMRLHGVPARRVGNYSNAELMEVAS